MSRIRVKRRRFQPTDYDLIILAEVVRVSLAEMHDANYYYGELIKRALAMYSKLAEHFGKDVGELDVHLTKYGYAGTCKGVSLDVPVGSALAPPYSQDDLSDSSNDFPEPEEETPLPIKLRH